MKRIIISFLLFVVFFTGKIYPGVTLSILPGAQLWGETVGFGGLALLQFDSVFSSVNDRNLFIQAGLGLSWVNLTGFNYMNYLIGIGMGYHWHPFAGTPLSFTPSLLIGSSFGHRYNDFGMEDLRVNMSVIPMISLDFDIANGFKLGAAAGSHIFFNGEYSAVNWMASLNISFALTPVKNLPKATDDRLILAEDIKLIASHKNLDIQVDSSQTNKITLNLPDISFEVKSDKIGKDMKNLLENIAVEMSKYPTVYIFIEGHTDDTGKETDNQILSEKRAKNVADIFILSGFPEDHVFFVGYGESKPIVPNTSAENRAKNRCVIIQFIWDYQTELK